MELDDKIKRVWTIHGFNVADMGSKTTDLVLPYIERAGYIALQHDYGNLGLLGVRTRTQFIAECLAYKVQPGDAFIAHSHGCLIAAIALELGAPFVAGTMVHPALNVAWEPPDNSEIENIAVFYSPSDWPTKMARTLRLFSPGRFIWGEHRWGAMGTEGPNSRNPVFSSYPDAEKHSSSFSRIDTWGPIYVSAMFTKRSELSL